MTNKLKILIAYDGSDCADAALADLQRAGLPAEVEAIVLSVDEQWLPVPTSYWLMQTSHSSTHPVAPEVQDTAERAATCLRELFPAWQVRTEAHSGSPASLILAAAAEWQPDLLVIGSHGRTGLVKLLLGSVSQKVLHQAPCPVRVARGGATLPATPIKIIVGLDGSAGAEAAAQAVAQRTWPAQTEVVLISVVPQIPLVSSSQVAMPMSQWFMEERARVQDSATKLAEELRSTGLNVSALLKEGEPKSCLLDEAERLSADCIFVGAAGINAIDRLLLGSVSGTVAARATCSVEIVRASNAQALQAAASAV